GVSVPDRLLLAPAAQVSNSRAAASRALRVAPRSAKADPGPGHPLVGTPVPVRSKEEDRTNTATCQTKPAENRPSSHTCPGASHQVRLSECRIDRGLARDRSERG